MIAKKAGNVMSPAFNIDSKCNIDSTWGLLHDNFSATGRNQDFSMRF